MPIEIVPRKGIITLTETAGFFTHVIISINISADTRGAFSGIDEAHYFCTEAEIEKTLKEAKWYKDSVTKVLTIGQYMAEGHACIHVKCSEE